jgi:hypothetical protein
MVASRSDALDTLQLAVSGAASRLPERVAVRNRALRARPMLARPGILVSNCPSRWQRDSPFCPPPRSAERASPGGEEGPTHSCPAALAGGDPNRREFG